VRFGPFDVATLVDGEGSFATMTEVFPALASTEPWWLPVNVVLVRTGGTAVLVDTGLGPRPREFMPEADARLPRELARIGVVVEDVDLVVHTHLHVDHVGWNGSFPNARYVVNEDDWSYFMSEESLADRPHLREKTQPLHEAGLIDLVSGEHELLPGVRLVPTPGHTPGHTSIRLNTQDRALVVLGDVVVHEVQLGDPDLLYVSDHDPSRAAVMRTEFLGQLADEGAAVIASHFEGIGQVVRAGDGFRWELLAKEDAAPVE
jgi:glyoxylase-like metal-dependent hydrolase (beta-lactamase superfamily II)